MVALDGEGDATFVTMVKRSSNAKLWYHVNAFAGNLESHFTRITVYYSS